MFNVFSDLFILSLDSVFARQHVIKPIHLDWRENQVHELANAHQYNQLQQQTISVNISPESLRLRISVLYTISLDFAESQQSELHQK